MSRKQTKKPNQNQRSGKPDARRPQGSDMGKQGPKDDSQKRINLDNERVSRYKKGMEDIKFDKVSGCNDISWYSNNPEMLISAGSIPFASITGQTVDPYKCWVPGVMSFNYIPNCGSDGGRTITISSTSTNEEPPYAINQAAKSIYSYIVHANSRNYNYTAADLMTMIYAGTQPFLLLASAMRAYGICMYYKEQNRYYPDSVLQAMGFDPDNFRSNLSTIWFDINEMISRTKQLWIPNVMPAFTRWMWMNTNIYFDAEDPKAQTYLYVQDKYFQYWETASNGSAIGPVLVNTSPSIEHEFRPGHYNYTWQMWKQAFNIMMDSLVNSEDRGIIMGDILNAYGSDKIFSLGDFPVDYRVEPVYNAEVMTQFENLVTAPLANFSGLCQYEENLYPIWDTTTAASLDAAVKKQLIAAVNTIDASLLNFHIPSQPTPADVMIATRMAWAGSMYQDNITGFSISRGSNGKIAENLCNANMQGVSNIWFPAYAGTEVCFDIAIYGSVTATNPSIARQQPRYCWNSVGSIGVTYAWDDTTGLLKPTLVPNAIQNVYYCLKDFNSFDWHPFIYEQSINGTGDNITAGVLGVYGDYYNYTTVSSGVMRKLHTTAIYSEWGVPVRM